MMRNLDSPVQTQMPFGIPDRSLSGEDHGRFKGDGRPCNQRRIFVQTDTGSVFGMELDRRDNVHTVKKRLQLALNVPTDESSLTFGDQVFKSDLSTVPNDSALLLTRGSLHRSSSTPCLSPTTNNLQQWDPSGPIEILGCSSRSSPIKQLVKDAVKGIRCGVDPVAVQSGLGGAYFFRNNKGEKLAIVKPTDEEPYAPNNPKGFVGKALGQPGLKRSVRIGETGFREVAAYLLDHDHFANVPSTALVKITHSVFNVNEGVIDNPFSKSRNRMPCAVSKIASFQQYIPHDFDASDYGASSFPVAAVHRIGILDIRIFNTDRHGGNLLVRKLNGVSGRFGAQLELTPIDHGLCLPETLEDPYFEWIHWPQASIPFSEEELEYICNLDPVKDSEMLRLELPMIREACLRILVLSTIFLKEAAAFGLCLAEIGEMMSRELGGVEEEPSKLELLCIEAKRVVAERELFSFSPRDGQVEDDLTQFHIDFEDADLVTLCTPPAFSFGRSGPFSRNPSFSLDSLEEEDDDHEKCVEESSFSQSTPKQQHTDISKLSASLKCASLAGKNQRLLGGVPKYSGTTLSFNNCRGFAGLQGWNSRSADEQVPASGSFVKLGDIGQESWASFLEKFQELLRENFRNRKHNSTAARQRLGTSCQF